MGNYDEKEVLLSAQRFYNSRARCGRSWEEVLEIRKTYTSSEGADYNDPSIPESAYYNPNSKGLMGAHYVGD